MYSKALFIVFDIYFLNGMSCVEFRSWQFLGYYQIYTVSCLTNVKILLGSTFDVSYLVVMSKTKNVQINYRYQNVLLVQISYFNYIFKVIDSLCMFCYDHL